MKYIQINPADNVAVAVQLLKAGEKLSIGEIVPFSYIGAITENFIEVKEEIPAGHKVEIGRAHV